MRPSALPTAVPQAMTASTCSRTAGGSGTSVTLTLSIAGPADPLVKLVNARRWLTPDHAKSEIMPPHIRPGAPCDVVHKSAKERRAPPLASIFLTAGAGNDGSSGKGFAANANVKRYE